jgi:hypothetical protein
MRCCSSTDRCPNASTASFTGASLHKSKTIPHNGKHFLVACRAYFEQLVVESNWLLSHLLEECLRALADAHCLFGRDLLFLLYKIVIKYTHPRLRPHFPRLSPPIPIFSRPRPPPQPRRFRRFHALTTKFTHIFTQTHTFSHKITQFHQKSPKNHPKITQITPKFTHFHPNLPTLPQIYLHVSP